MILEYWHEYRTYFHLGKSYGISESNCYRNIKWIEDTLIKSQVIIEAESKKIIATNFSPGKQHDFSLLWELKILFPDNTQIIVDSGYQGLQKSHYNVLLPARKSKKTTIVKLSKIRK